MSVFNLSLPSFTPAFGIVEDINDPDENGRVKVRVFGMHPQDLSSVSTAALPWIHVAGDITDANTSGLGVSPVGVRVGSHVLVLFTDQDYQNYIVLGTIPGFHSGQNVSSDEYPREEYKNATSVNPLARGIEEGTIVPGKRSGVKTGVQTALSLSTWDEPETQYNAQYTFNRVYEGPSGNIVEIDDTPDSERVHVYHPSGSFVEIHPNGDMVLKTTGSLHHIVDGDYRVIVGGEMSFTSGGDTKMQSQGSFNVSCAQWQLFAQGGMKQLAGGFAQFQASAIALNGSRIDLNGATPSITFT